MTQFTYKVHVVPYDVFNPIRPGDSYEGGEVVDGTGGMNDDCLLITAHPVTRESIASAAAAVIGSGHG